jgi:hypothetical protein
MRASQPGSPDNQRHALSFSYVVYDQLQLHPLEVLGLEALGPLGLSWKLDAAQKGGWAAGPVLTAAVLADEARARACRLIGAAVSWRYQRSAYNAQVAEFERLIAAGKVEWRTRTVTAEQKYLLMRITEIIRADNPYFEEPTPRNRGEAFDLIKALGGNPLFHDGTDAMITARVCEILTKLGKDIKNQT